MTWLRRLQVALVICSLSAGMQLQAAQLQPETLRAWHEYVLTVDSNIKTRLSAGRFLWVNEESGRKQSVAQGELKVAPVVEHGSRSVPGGLIHHWVGAAFIPNATMDEVVSVTRDYSRYKQFFNPEVKDSRSLGQDGGDDRFMLRWATRVLFVSSGVDTQFVAKNVHVDSRKFYQIAETTRVQEIENFGKANEKEMEPDEGSGYIWRLYTVTRYEAAGDGVFLELEVLALTRDIPKSMRVLVSPIVRKLSTNSLLLSLRQTRDAVLSNKTAFNVAHNNVPVKGLDTARGN